MKDRNFLIWLHERLERVHGESPYVDYMHRLRGIIEHMPADRETPHVASTNGIDDLVRKLKEADRIAAEPWLRRVARRYVLSGGKQS